MTALARRHFPVSIPLRTDASGAASSYVIFPSRPPELDTPRRWNRSGRSTAIGAVLPLRVELAQDRHARRLVSRVEHALDRPALRDVASRALDSAQRVVERLLPLRPLADADVREQAVHRPAPVRRGPACGTIRDRRSGSPPARAARPRASSARSRPSTGGPPARGRSARRRPRFPPRAMRVPTATAARGGPSRGRAASRSRGPSPSRRPRRRGGCAAGCPSPASFRRTRPRSRRRGSRDRAARRESVP